MLRNINSFNIGYRQLLIVKRVILIWSILLIFPPIQSQPSFANLALDGQIHTHVSYIDLEFQTHNGGNLYENNVTVIEISANVQIWNTDSQPQLVGYNWYAPYCGYYLDVVMNITGETTIYDGDPEFQTVCGLLAKYYDPGLTVENAMIKFIFNTSDLLNLPSGVYNITAPTSNGFAYTTTLISDDGFLEYEIEEIPNNWGEINDASNSDTDPLPISLISLIISIPTLLTLRFLVKNRSALLKL